MFAALSNFLHRTPWWALILLGLTVLALLGLFTTPFKVIQLQQSADTPEQKRAIQREIDSSVGQSVLDVAEEVVKTIHRHSQDPAHKAELARAIREIARARSKIEAELGDAGSTRRALGEAARDAAQEAFDAAQARLAEHDIVLRIVPGGDLAQAEGKARGKEPMQSVPPGGPQLPSELRQDIHRKVASDLLHIGVGAALILLFIPLFIMALVAKFFIDRARRSQELAELKKIEAEYHNFNRQITEAKLQALQAQVEPHFLYNTLANVQALTEVDPAAAHAMVGHLIQYLRAALPKMRENVSTVGQEVELAQAYLNILKMRMGERLSFSIELADAARPLAFPPLMLPSLVENAIKHGLEPLREGGRIDIVACVAGNRLSVSVRDTGRGFKQDAEVLGGGVGLANLRARLAALYGGVASFSIEANQPKGVVATIEIPLAAIATSSAAASPAPDNGAVDPAGHDADILAGRKRNPAGGTGESS